MPNSSMARPCVSLASLHLLWQMAEGTCLATKSKGKGNPVLGKSDR